MRRLLLVPALALVLLGTPVLALETPEPPPTTTTTIPLTPETGEAPSTTQAAPETTPTTAAGTAETPVAPEEAVTAGWESDTTPVDATLVGVTWEGDPAAEFVVEVQSTDGSWSETHLEAADTGVDAGTPDEARAEAFPDNATEPLWVGDDATAVRVVLEEGVASAVEVAAIDSEPAPAPDGAAGAITGTLGTVDGVGRWVFGAVLLVVVALLVALALGWRPRGRWRATRWLAAVAGALLLAACVPVAPPPPVTNGPYPPQPALVQRSQWGARPFACSEGPKYAPKLKFAVVHHTVNSNDYGPGSSTAIVRGIQSYHLDALGYCDIAYQFLIDRFGRPFVGRAGGVTRPVIGGHAGGFNTGSVGVALIGDFSGVQPSGEGWNSLVNLLRWRLSIAKLDPSVPTTITVGDSPCGCQRWPAGTQVYLDNLIWGHRDLNTTACPGAAFAPRRGELRSAVQAGIRFPQ